MVKKKQMAVEYGANGPRGDRRRTLINQKLAKWRILVRLMKPNL